MQTRILIAAALVAVLSATVGAHDVWAQYNYNIPDPSTAGKARHTASLLGFSTTVTEACSNDMLSGAPTMLPACEKWVDIFEKHMTALLTEAGPEVQEIMGFNPVPTSSSENHDDGGELSKILKNAQENAIAS